MSKKELFFNNDTRAGYFLAANYPNQDYTNCGDCEDKLLQYIMRSKFQNSTSNSDESIHSKFTDFIVLVAKFHRSIDEPWPDRSDINAIVRSCHGLLKKPCEDWGINRIEVVVDGAAEPFKIFANCEKLSIYEVLNQMSVTVKTMKPVPHYDTIIVLTNAVDGEPYEGSVCQFLGALASGCGFKATDVSPAGLEWPRDDLFKRANIDTFIHFLNNNMELERGLDRAYGGIPRGAEVKLLIMYAFEICKAFQTRLIEDNPLTPGKLDGMENLINGNTQTVNINIRQAAPVLDRDVMPNYRGSLKYSELLDSIITATGDDKLFYDRFVNLLWHLPQNRRYHDTVVENPTSADKADYRINLKKDQNITNKEVTLFEQTLPEIPKGSNVHVTNADGEKIILPFTSTDILRQIYNGIYTNAAGYTSPNGVVITGNQTRTSESFSLNHVMNITKQLKSKSSSSSNTLQDLVTNSIWHRDKHNNLFRYNANGSKEPISNSIQSIENSLTNKCFRTKLDMDDDDPKCQSIFFCLLHNDTKKLNKCLANLDTNHFDQATNDASNTNPYSVIHVLKQVGVKSKQEQVKLNSGTHVTIDVPMTVEEWLNSIGDESIKKSIESNQGFKNYISGLIKWVRENPSILNKNLSSNTRIINSQNFCGLKKWRSPSNTVKASYKMLKNFPKMTYPVLNSNNQTLLPFMNTSFTGNPMQGGGSQKGGSHHISQSHIEHIMNPQVNEVATCSSVHDNIIDNIKRDLQTIGFKLSESDDKKINDAINSIKQQEENLVNLHRVLQNLIDYGRLNGIDCRYSNQENSIKINAVNSSNDLSDIKSEEDLQNYINTNVTELQRCINNSNRINCGIQNDLITKVIPSLLMAPQRKQKYSELRT